MFPKAKQPSKQNERAAKRTANLDLLTRSALVVKPDVACVMLDIGMTRLYELINEGELQTFKDGRSRKITTASISAFIARMLAKSA